MPAETTNLRNADPMRTIAAAPPRFAESHARAVLLDNYDLTGDLQPLLGERDQNWLLETVHGERFVLKIANAAEDPVVTDFQIRALLHLESRDCPIAVPRIVPTRDRKLSVQLSDGTLRHVARVVTFVPGQPMNITLLDKKIAFEIGVAIAEIHLALADFSHAGDEQPLLWDLQRALELRPLLRHIPGTKLRAEVSDCLDDFGRQSLPYLRSNRRQVIHGDINPGNVMLGKDAASVTGIIDFGDMVRAPVIVDLAIAASYLRVLDTDPLEAIGTMVSGYESVSELANDALGVLRSLIRTRLATSIALLHWRMHARGRGDAYSDASVDSEGDAAQFMESLGAIGEQRFRERILQIIGR